MWIGNVSLSFLSYWKFVGMEGRGLGAFVYTVGTNEASFASMTMGALEMAQSLPRQSRSSRGHPKRYPLGVSLAPGSGDA
jgi:hypothetical protein